MQAFELLPFDRAFTWQEAVNCGVTRRQLRQLIDAAFVRVLFRGLFVRYDVQLDRRARTQALSLVLPRRAIATDETAAWWHGVDLYRGLDADGLPRLQFFHREANHRLKTHLVDSGSRQLTVTDIERLGPVRVTTPLRTAVDLARLAMAPGHSQRWMVC